MVVTRRQLLIGAAGLVAVGAAGAGYFVLGGQSIIPDASSTGAPSVNAKALIKPGPLGDMALGNPKAPVTMIEYASMTCPHCANFEKETFPALKKRYIDTGKVYFIFREFPLDQLALAASMLARCAGKDKYFPLVETLFQQQQDWVVQQPLKPLLAIAKQAGLTEQTFNGCLKDQKIQQAIVDEQQRAIKQFGVQSTPTFFINGKPFRGEATVAEMEKEIKPYLPKG